MQIVQKLYIEFQEIVDQNKIKTGHFWFQGQKYKIENGEIKNESGNAIQNTTI